MILILLIGVLSSLSPVADDYPKNPSIDAINYAFHLTLSDESDRIVGLAKIDLAFRSDGVRQVRLDLIGTVADGSSGMNVTDVTVGGASASFSHENDVLLIDLLNPSTNGERITVEISYSGVPATGLIIGDNKYGDRTFFSDNWPNRARNWLPTIDHPYDKAMCEFIVTAPDHYQVISNGLKLEETSLGNGNKLTHWKQSVPIASWLYVLGVARFAVQYVDTFEGKSIQTWVYHQDRDAGFYDFAVPTKKALEFYSDYIGPFSYEKLANIQSNSVGGGMEAASAIFYGDDSVTGDRSERWRNVIIHEIAHQWFGNAVTEYDWDDVWLSEGFATYFTLLFIEHAYGREAFVDGLKKSYAQVKTFYDSRPDYVLIHDGLSDMSQVTTRQTYQKGSWTLHMLRGLVGDDAFWSGIQTYYEEFKDINATTDDFRRHMELSSGRDLGTFFDQWLYKPGHPVVSGDWAMDGDTTLEVRLEQVQSDGSFFELPIQIGVYLEGEMLPSVKTIYLSNSKETFRIPVTTAPERVVLDPDTWLLMESDFKQRM